MTFGFSTIIPESGAPAGIIGKTLSSFTTSATTPVPETAVIGRVFASELQADPNAPGGFANRPLAGVTITVDGAEETSRTVTGPDGRFTLSPVPAGRFFVHVDGRTATASQWPNGDYYPIVGKAWDTIAGREDNLAGGNGEVYLPRASAWIASTSNRSRTCISLPCATDENTSGPSPRSPSR